MKRPEVCVIPWFSRIAALMLFFVSVSSTYADQADPLSPEDSMASMHVADGIEIELVAAEPEITDPVALCFDASGNLYVAEDRAYPSGNTDGSKGSVALLQDRDGDGRYEHRTTFAEGFDFPNGIMPWKGGILLTAAPNVYFLKDTDGDLKADVREVFLQGFKLGGSTQLYVSHPTLSLDNWIHFTNGLSGGEVSVPSQPGIPAVNMGSNDIRYNPITHALEARGGRAQFGLTFDDAGNKFVCSNRQHIQHVVMEPGDLARNPYLNASNVVKELPEHGAASPVFAKSDAVTTAYAHEGTFTAACGMVIYRGKALEPSFYGNNFVCDPTGNLVHRDILSKDGGSFTGKRGEHEQKSEFLASTDNWSRPVFLSNGPDGALYMCDMYRKSIEHPTYLPDEVAAITDFESGKKHGRIYRIKSKGGKTSGDTTLDVNEPEALVAALGHPNGWQRDTAQRLLLERQHALDGELLKTTFTKSTLVQGRIRALHLLFTLGWLDEPLLNSALRDSSAEVRLQGLRLVRLLPLVSVEIKQSVTALAQDADPHVRFACAVALGDNNEPDEATLVALATILRANIDDHWTRSALLSAIDAAPLEFAYILLKDDLSNNVGWLELMEGLSRIFALVENPESTKTFMNELLNVKPTESERWRLAALQGVLSGVQGNKLFPKGGSTAERLDGVTLVSAPEQEHDLNDWVSTCLAIIQSDTPPIEAKRRAIDVLRHTDFDTSGETLVSLLTPLTPQDVQVAVIAALNGFKDERVAKALLQRSVWLGFSTETRKVAINGLLNSTAGIEALLTAMESSDVEAWSIDPRSRTRLERVKDGALNARIKTVFSSVHKVDPKKRYEEFRSVLELTPDSVNGKKMFEKTCMACHRYNEIGFDVGPDLSGIHSQPLESILMHIINPNWLMVSGFESYFIETKDGEAYVGLIGSETESSITIDQAQGIKTTVLRKDIEVMESNSLSMMPEQLEANMTRQELRDLLGFLKAER
jgi:putative membrane-bound dehydrogenase-like protein